MIGKLQSSGVTLRPVVVSLVRLKPEEIQMYSRRYKLQAVDNAHNTSEDSNYLSMKIEMKEEDELQFAVKEEEELQFEEKEEQELQFEVKEEEELELEMNEEKEDTWRTKAYSLEIHEVDKIEFEENVFSSFTISSDSPTSTANDNVIVPTSTIEEICVIGTNTKKDSIEFPCSVCKKVFRKKGHMTRHLLIHDREKPYGCDFCPQRFSAKKSLETHHVRIHDMDAKPFACRVCDQRFTWKAELITHNNELTEEQHLRLKEGLPLKGKSYPCEKCGKEFKWSYNLSRHEITHKWQEGDTSDLKLFKCDLCDKEFVSRRTFLRHLKAHEDEAKEEESKVFNCEFCDKTFSFSQSLLMHSQFHKESRDKPFECGTCEIRFTTEDLWKRHLESVAHIRKQGELASFKCQYCERTFAWKHSCLRHEMSHKNGLNKPDECDELPQQNEEDADDLILGLPTSWNEIS